MGSSRWLAALALWPALLAAGPAAAGSDRAPAAGAGWLWVQTGLSLHDVVAFDTAAARQSEGGGALVFAVGAHHRFGAVDLGVLVEHLASVDLVDPLPGTAPAAPTPSGGQVRAAASLRWRYLEGGLGALALGLTPGVLFLDHADGLRAEAAALATGDDGAALDGVDTHGLGFCLGLDLGALAYLDDGLAVSARLSLVVGHAALGTSEGELDLSLLRGHLSLGLEWTM